MTPEAQLLAAAAAVVARGWSRERPAEDRNGAPVEPSSRLARRWSAPGALDAVWHYRCRASPDPDRLTSAFERASRALVTVMGDPEVWNRAPDRTRDDVLAAFERAIRLCEEPSISGRGWWAVPLALTIRPMTRAAIGRAEYQSAASLRAALRKFLRVSEQAARKHGLTQQRYLLLLMIKGAPNRSERSTVTELAERLQLAQSTVTELLGRAEEAGLVAREASREDGRVVFFSLTREGDRRLAAVVRELRAERDVLARIVAALGASPLGEELDVDVSR